MREKERNNERKEAKVTRTKKLQKYKKTFSNKQMHFKQRLNLERKNH